MALKVLMQRKRIDLKKKERDEKRAVREERAVSDVLEEESGKDRRNDLRRH